MPLAIAIAGAAGRMGRALLQAALERNDLRISGGSGRTGSDAIGADLGALAGSEPLGVLLSNTIAVAAEGADVWIDFTTPEATIAALDALPQNVRAAIVGTTGLSSKHEAEIANAAKRLAVVRSGNFSLGVNMLAALVQRTAARLGPEWDIEIIEAHHRRKVDAPSGTALMLGEAAARGRKGELEALRSKPYDGRPGARAMGKIGFASIRGGGIVGEHDVKFVSEREVITLRHQALDRALFADGALAAALWAADKKPGLYTMSDVLGF
jgi:4-hydroxy-tetrahydrodipicolinate reductase